MSEPAENAAKFPLQISEESLIKLAIASDQPALTGRPQASPGALIERYRRELFMISPEHSSQVETPAFVIDERVIARRLGEAAALREATGCKILYTLKPLAFDFVLELMPAAVDGFAVSSLFEAKLARSIVEPGAGSIHITTPGIRPADVPELVELCDMVTFNSIGQLERFGGVIAERSNIGLRVNPGFSSVKDPRYNPCRKSSKLGVPLAALRTAIKSRPELFEGIGGLHFHTNCDGESFAPLWKTAEALEAALGRTLGSLQWINFGGGYLLEAKRARAFEKAVALFRDRHGLEVYFEPGATFVRDAGFIITEVIDLFRSDGRTVAVLDTTINHFPEVFEYQFEPEVIGDSDSGEHEYLLAGSSCLAGDLLGLYGFDEPLEIGSRLILPEMGAYTMVKAHMFNGINLPSIYSVTADGSLVERRRFTFDDFHSRWGATRHAAV